MTGVVFLDKPKGITSFGAVARVRRICGEKKCGHSGTLDPMATGVMTVLLGGATRFCELLPSHDKAYVASFRLGTVTDTLDITGKIIETKPVSSTEAEVREALASFEGEISQLPPMYSAVSVDGQRLYDLARQGIEVERKARNVTVYSINMISSDEAAGEYTAEIACSTGTYIRSLVSDLGEKLGCGAVLTDLRRTKANGFDIEKTVTLEELEAFMQNGETEKFLHTVDSVLGEYPEVHVTEAQAKRFSNGGELALERLRCVKMAGYFRVYGPENKFIGLGEIDGSDSMKVKRVYQG